jgi:hypothetical protein
MNTLDANGISREYGPEKLRKMMDDNAILISSPPTGGSAWDLPPENDIRLPDQPNPGLPLWWHGDTEPGAGRSWLVEDLLPEVGTAIIAGPWGSYKTFIAVDLAVSVMARSTFAGRSVNKRCGVLYIAAEGVFEVPLRLEAAYCELASHDSKLPFAMVDQCPRLLDQNATRALQGTARSADERLRSTHHVGLGLIIIDTMAAAAGFKDENSNAEVQCAMNVCAKLAQEFKCLVVVVDHFGKAVETGVRGGSAKEASADAVLAVLVDRDKSGNLSGPKLAVRKVRGAQTGSEIPFGVKRVSVVGKNSKAQTTLVVQWRSEGEATKAVPTKKWPKGQRILYDSLIEALINCGIDTTPFTDGPVLRCVDSEHIRKEFYKRYTADGDTDQKKQEACRKAYNRNKKVAQDSKLIGVRNFDGKTIVWIIASNKKPDGQDRQDSSLALIPDVPFEEDVASGGTGDCSDLGDSGETRKYIVPGTCGEGPVDEAGDDDVG